MFFSGGKVTKKPWFFVAFACFISHFSRFVQLVGCKCAPSIPHFSYQVILDVRVARKAQMPPMVRNFVMFYPKKAWNFVINAGFMCGIL